MIDSIELELRFHAGTSSTCLIEALCRTPRSDTDITLATEVPVTIDQEALTALRTDPYSYGRRLFTDVFHVVPLRVALGKALMLADTLALLLRLRLTIPPSLPHLQALMWELLIDPDTNQPLLNDRVALVRASSSADARPTVIPARGQLRSLAVIANPVNLARYRLAPLQLPIECALAKFFLGTSQLTLLAGDGAATASQLVAALREGVDILYLVAHGTIVNREAYLWLEDSQGNAARIAATELSALIAGLPRLPRLAVLVSCWSAGDDAEIVTATLGARLSAAGIPAVVAMQGQLSVAGAQRLLPTLFRELKRDGRIDRALAVARSAARLAAGNHDWWRPTLYLRSREARIWKVLVAQRSASPGGDIIAPPGDSPYLWHLTNDQRLELARQIAACTAVQHSDAWMHLRTRLPHPLRVEARGIAAIELAAMMIDAASTLPWGMETLLDEVRALEQNPAIRDTLNEIVTYIRPQPVQLSHIASVKAHLRPLRLEERVVRAAYHRVAPADAPPLADPLGIGLLPVILHRLAQLPVPAHVSHPLLRFLTDLAPMLPQATREVVAAWIRHVGAEIGDVHIAATPATPAPVTQLSLLIELAPVEHGRFRMQAWIWGPRQDVLYAEDTSHSLATIRLQLLPELYERIVDDVMAAHGDLVVEFFLPQGLMTEAVDQWDLAGEPLGIRHHVMIRSQERARSRLFWPPWHRHWEQLGSLQHPLADDLIEQVRAVEECRQRQLRQRLDRTVILAVACGLPSAAEIRQGVLQAILASGTPIALWPHTPLELALGGTSDVTALLVDRKLATLPEAIRRRRLEAYAAETEATNTAITLLWDDPTRLPQRLQRYGAPRLAGATE